MENSKGGRTTVWMKPNEHEKLRRFAFENKMTNSDVIRQALERLYVTGGGLQAKTDVFPKVPQITAMEKHYVDDTGLLREKFEQ